MRTFTTSESPFCPQYTTSKWFYHPIIIKSCPLLRVTNCKDEVIAWGYSPNCCKTVGFPYIPCTYVKRRFWINSIFAWNMFWECIPLWTILCILQPVVIQDPVFLDNASISYHGKSLCQWISYNSKVVCIRIPITADQKHNINRMLCNTALKAFMVAKMQEIPKLVYMHG